MKIKEFFKTWKYNMENLTPENILLSKYYTYFGVIASHIFAVIYLIVYDMWYIAPILFFSGAIQFIDLLSVWQQIKQLKKMKDIIMNNFSEHIENTEEEVENGLG